MLEVEMRLIFTPSSLLTETKALHSNNVFVFFRWCDCAHTRVPHFSNVICFHPLCNCKHCDYVASCILSLDACVIPARHYNLSYCYCMFS